MKIQFMVLINMKRSSDTRAIIGPSACEMFEFVIVETSLFILNIKPIQCIGKY